MVGYPPLWDLVRNVIEAGHRAEREIIHHELSSLPGPLLDLPCGTAIYATELQDSDYIGVDLDLRLLRYARHKFPGRIFTCMDALRVGFADESFARVLVVGFLHHLGDEAVEQCLDELHRILRVGGTLLLIEDAPTRSRWNLPGRLLQRLDAGDIIRPAEWYETRLQRRFRIVRQEALLAGLWDYTVFVLRKEPDPSEK